MTFAPSRGLSRRRLLAGGAALLAAPALGPALAQGVSDADVVIIGGGAAGIAAARKVAQAGRSHLLLEAGPALGGRARTETAFGLPVDLGAASFGRDPEGLSAAARADDLPLTTLAGERLFVDGHDARESAYDAFAAALGRDRREIVTAADAGRDVAVARVLPPPGPWSASAGACLGPLGLGKELDALSTLDLALRAVVPDDLSSPIGVGALLEGLGARLNRQTHAPVNLITNNGRFHTVSVTGQRATIRARAIVLAVPAPVIAAGAIRFNPVLPPRLLAAFRAFPAGALEQVAFLLPGNPLGLQPDERVLATRPDALAPTARLRGRVNGTDLHVLTFGGTPARQIAEKGEAAALTLARDFLTRAFGGGAGATISEVVASRWTGDPLIRGAIASAMPGQGSLRRLFTEPVQNRIFLAGEYAALEDWGTLAGAWASGEIAAAKALRVLGDGPA
ncbi:flavin monoamine oxidase family protein [Ancylobacter sp. SL191]|uniref:flavin monoamine oxidase family protein n=1 Tax=Ancylobacter sp. SL191 TaxID=2995166 RepID=UPI0022719A3F|nr:FAD-dependent oxidoreductase [Ancylobacter sp. SL191]WAC28047.1 FAD-dependent oxidoreductase [Ancylobacter sp. SL191]